MRTWLSNGLVAGFIFIVLSVVTGPASAVIWMDGEPGPEERFGLREDGNYRNWFAPYLQAVDVFAPERDASIVRMLQGSFERLKGIRRPVRSDNVNVTRITHEIWLVKSKTIDTPSLRWEKIEVGNARVPYAAALISVPSSWDVERLTPNQKTLLDGIVFEASPELRIVTFPGGVWMGDGREYLGFEDYVREWQTNLKYEYYLKYPQQINDQTVRQVYQDLVVMSGVRKYLGKWVEAYSASMSAPEIRQHLQRLSEQERAGSSCKNLFRSAAP